MCRQSAVGLGFKLYDLSFRVQGPGVRIVEPTPALEWCAENCSRVNSAQIRQSGPDSGPDFQVKALKTFQAVPFLFKSGWPRKEEKNRKEGRGRVGEGALEGGLCEGKREREKECG